MTNIKRVDYQALCTVISKRLHDCGIAQERARIETETIVEADLQGVPSHGVRMLPALIRALNENRVKTSPIEKTLNEFGAISFIDFDNGPGRFSSHYAMDKAIHTAAQFGIGLCLAKNTSHWGRAQSYASKAAQQGYIGICGTNAISTMAAWGATDAVMGNNPLAIGVPGPEEDCPIVMDIAMSQIAMGKLGTMLREGSKPSEPLGFDKHGHISSDPRSILAGAVRAMGGHKGESLSLMVELLTAALACAPFTHELTTKDQNGVDAFSTKIFIALKIEAFVELKQYRKNIDRFFIHLKEKTPEFRYPSERAWKARKSNINQGVPIHTDIINELKNIDILL